MCSRCLSNSNCSLYVLKRSIVLLWCFWIGFLFVFIKACAHDATWIIRYFCTVMMKSKIWFMNQWIWKELCTSQNKTLSAFSLSPHVKVSQTLAQSFIVPEFWTRFSIELNRKLVQSSVNWFYYCTVKELLFSEDFYQRFDWQIITIDFTTTRLCRARGSQVVQMLVFSFLWTPDFRFLHKNGC